MYYTRITYTNNTHTREYTFRFQLDMQSQKRNYVRGLTFITTTTTTFIIIIITSSEEHHFRFSSFIVPKLKCVNNLKLDLFF